MKDTPEKINSRIIDAEEWTSDLKDRMVKITATKQNTGKKRMKKILGWMKHKLESRLLGEISTTSIMQDDTPYGRK